ncbi:modifier of mdg4-like isoform X6 [Anopheles stephensi]|uniref:modifier of mdg4-like isoform X6 n=1 Tax=Anopheles stephensi TaxID=30069 RepID=UPI001658BB1B|nr:modifier of mdg4-like isoform X6 [Anopheles stephensi]
MADDEQFSLCWNNFNSNLSAGFHESLQRGDLVDVTLAAEGQLVQAHRLVLSVCSPYFRKMFNQMPKNQHAFVFLKDVTHSALQDLIQFMYCGEVNVKQDALPAFISTAEALQIKGLTETGDSAPAQQSPVKEDPPAVPVATASISTTVPVTPQRTKVQRNRIQSYKLESEESGDDKIVHLQASTSHHVTAQQLQAQTSASSQKRAMPQRGVQSHASKRTKMSISASSDGLDTSDTVTTPTQAQTIQTVQIVKQLPAQVIEPEYIELPMESVNPKAEPDYTDEAAEIETVDAETEQEHKLSEHEQGDADDDGNYVEDETYGDMGMGKYEESYLTEGEEGAKPGVSGFVDSYTSDGGTGTEQSTQAASTPAASKSANTAVHVQQPQQQLPPSSTAAAPITKPTEHQTTLGGSGSSNKPRLPRLVDGVRHKIYDQVPLHAGSSVYIATKGLLSIYTSKPAVYTGRLVELMFGVETLKRSCLNGSEQTDPGLVPLDPTILDAVITHIVDVFQQQRQHITTGMVRNFIRNRMELLRTNAAIGGGGYLSSKKLSKHAPPNSKA